jgi:hypothetical protein
VVGAGWVDASGSVTCAVTDSLGNTYTAARAKTRNATQAFSFQTFYAWGVTGSASTVTITATISTGAAFGDIHVTESTSSVGSWASDPLDTATNTATGNSTALATPTITPTVNNCMLVTFGGANNGTITAGTGYTLRSTGANGIGIADLVQTTAAAKAGLLTTSVSSQWGIQVVAFKDAAAVSVTITDKPAVARAVATTATVSTGTDVTVADSPAVGRAVATPAAVSTGVTIADKPSVARAVARPATVSTASPPGVPWLAQYVTGYSIACYLGFGVDPTTDPTTWDMTDVSSLVLQETGFSVTAGLQDEQQQSNSSVCTLTFKNFAGNLTTRRPQSIYWPYVTNGLPLLLQITDPLGAVFTQFEGYVDDMEQEYDSTGKAAFVHATAHGIMSGLAQGKPPLLSAPYRYLSRLTGTVPVASWTLEEGRLVTGGTPMYGPGLLRPFVGTHPSGAVVSYPQWGEGNLAPWLPPVVSPSASSGLTILWSPVVMPATPTTWTVDLAYASGSDAPDSGIDINPSYLGGDLGWPQLSTFAGDGQISVSFNSMPEVSSTVPGLYDGLVHHLRWTATQSGANVTWVVYLDGVSVNTGTATSYTLPSISRVAISTESGSGQVAIGYLSVWTTAVPVADMNDAIHGHTGETATARMRRLCLENGIPFDCSSESLRTMGPQGLESLATLLREAETVDGGTIRDGFGIYLAALNDRYNAVATMSPVLRDMVPPFAPVENTTYLRNDMVVSQTNGSSYEYIQPAGEPYAPTGPGGVGYFQGSLSLNTDTFDVIPQRAQWAVHEGTVDEDRYPTMTTNLARKPALIPSWLLCNVGSRITVATNYSLGGRPADVTLLGWTFTMSTLDAMVVMNCTPFAKYNIAVVDVARVSASNATLTAAITSSATSVQVTVSKLWTTDPAEFPMLLNLDGEGPVTCTAISGGSSPQTFTIVRGTGACAHRIGGRVNVWRPGVIGLIGA